MKQDIFFLSEMGIELTNRCNLTCIHCLRDGNLDKEDLPVELLRRILKEAKTYGISHIAFTGGEPTIHPQLDEILKIVTGMGFTYHIVTNAWNFMEVFPILEKYGFSSLKGLSFSLDSPTKDIHDKIRSPGSYDRVMRAISICFSKRIAFSLQMTICKFNMKQLEEMALLSSKLKAQKLFYAFIQPTPENIRARMVPSPSEQTRIAKEIKKLIEIMNIGIFVSPGFDFPELIFHCKALQMSSLTVDFRGNLVFCCQLSGYSGANSGADIIGSLKEMSLFEAHRKLVERIADFQKERIRRIETREISQLDRFPCFYCSKYFGKIDWLRDFPDNPWNED